MGWQQRARGLAPANGQLGPGPKVEPNRFAYWVSFNWRCRGQGGFGGEEITTTTPIHMGGQLKEIEQLLAKHVKAADPRGTPLVVGESARVAVIAFSPLRAFYLPEDANQQAERQAGEGNGETLPKA
jgi:hypothetical protein